MIVFLIARPTPQRIPVLDRLHAHLPGEVVVFYDAVGDGARGWGDLTLRHPATVLGRPGGRAALTRALTSPALRAVCLFGYRGWARIAAAAAARLRGVPLVLRGDTNVRDELARGPVRRALKAAYLRALLGQPEVWTIGSANAGYWSLMGFRRQVLIPYTVPVLPGESARGDALRADLGLDDRFVFGYVGRLETSKGIDDLLSAYERVAAALPGGAVGLVVAGTGDREHVVRRFAAAHPSCAVLGPVPYHRLGAVYAACDAIVVPSRQEGWGLVVNEALGVGTRVIASEAVGAAVDLCDGDNGRRFTLGPAALAAAMTAEYAGGRRRAPVLRGCDPTDAMMERIWHLTGWRGAALAGGDR